MSVPDVLVFGATGQIGSALVRHLLADHRSGRLRVSVVARKPEAASALAAEGLDVHKIDLDDAARYGLGALREAMQGVDRVFLLTGYSVSMLAQSKAVVDAAKAEGVSHVVHLGAIGKPDATKAYLAWHQLVEAYIARAGMGWTHLQPTTFMQNMTMLVALAGGAPGVVTNFIGDARLSWIDVEDIAAVAAAVLRDPKAHDGRTYQLATEATTMKELASLMTDVTGRPWRYEARDPELFERAVVGGGADPIYMGSVRQDFELLRKGLSHDPATAFDVVERVTGRAPTSLRKFIETHRSAFTYATPT